MIQLDTTYLAELKKKLEYEQWSSTAAKKLQDTEFKDLIECALYFLEQDRKIMQRTPPETGDAMRDITGA